MEIRITWTITLNLLWHCGVIRVNSVSGNGLLPDGTKPLHDPLLIHMASYRIIPIQMLIHSNTSHAILCSSFDKKKIWQYYVRQFHSKYPRSAKLQPYLPGTHELTLAFPFQASERLCARLHCAAHLTHY